MSDELDTNDGKETIEINPAWNELLEVIPEVLRPSVLPHLSKWDTNYQKSLEDLRTEYRPFEAFKGTNPADLQAGVDIVRALNSNPRELYDNIGAQFNFATSSVAESGDDEEFDLSSIDDKQLKALQQKQADLDARFEAQEEARQQQEGQKWYAEQEKYIIAQCQEKNLEVDLDYILGSASTRSGRGVDPTLAIQEATKAYIDRFSSVAKPIASATTTAPPVIPPSGAVPEAQQFDPSKLSDAERRAYGVKLLKEINAKG